MLTRDGMAFMCSSSGATTPVFEIFGIISYLFHVTRPWMHFVPLFIYIIITSPFISFFHAVFGLPRSPAHIGFHAYSFLTILFFLVRYT